MLIKVWICTARDLNLEGKRNAKSKFKLSCSEKGATFTMLFQKEALHYQGVFRQNSVFWPAKDTEKVSFSDKLKANLLQAMN